MYTIVIDEIEEGKSENLEIWIKGQRRITISLNKYNTSVQIPSTIKGESISITEGSFFVRTKDYS